MSKIDEKTLSAVADKALSHTPIFRAVADGEVRIGETKISCAVLNDDEETRVLSIRSIEDTLGLPRPKKRVAKIVGYFLPSFMGISALKPYIIADNLLATFCAIPYILRRGGRAFGFDAKLLPNVLSIWIAANKDGVLTKPQRRIADQAANLAHGLIGVGIIALIDESLHYEDQRRKSLRELLNQIIEERWHSWTKQIPLNFYEHLFRLWGKEDEWRKLLATSAPDSKPQTPSWVGGVTRDLVYARLKPAGVLDILEKKNPQNETGNRVRRHHQHLTEEVGLQILQRHIGQVLLLMKQSDNKTEFLRAMNTHLPIVSNQLQFDFMESDTLTGHEIHDDVHPSLV